MLFPIEGELGNAWRGLGPAVPATSWVGKVGVQWLEGPCPKGHPASWVDQGDVSLLKKELSVP